MGGGIPLKIDQNFIIQSFEYAVHSYREATHQVGLWESEKYVFTKYFSKEDKILDIGCGTGRTTFGLYELGYKHLVGLDLSPHMTNEALRIRDQFGMNIDFIQGDATELSYDDGSFDHALFSFNGLMQIPKKENRLKALKEIKRVLKTNGHFIFTTHDRNAEDAFKEFWIEEKRRWEKGNHDQRLYEYGDRLITTSEKERDIYIHIPDSEEVIETLQSAPFTIVEQFYRSDLFDEPEPVKRFSSDCMFWVVKKTE